jgi:CBS domain-containing protein
MSFRPTPVRYSAAPLASLPAVVIDTETTGLDAAKDRVIEIGAVRLAGGETRETYSTLVRPGVAIPPAASKVHGIHDADVADAPGFAEVAAAFSAWAGPAVVIGFSVGFDLAILKAEHERYGIPWKPPRSLDVRHLVELASPELPELSLELAAEWLGIEVADRHRALGDALLTGRIFLALVGKLRQRGITTLAQAERACSALTARHDEEARFGWHAVGRLGEPSAGLAEYARIDSFPYRHRVADLMRLPPIIVDASISLADALTTMVIEKVSSVYVAPSEERQSYGIVTERDVLRAVEADGCDALGKPVGFLARLPLITVNADEFAYRALTRMANSGFRHLGVLGADGELVGALSARDLLRQRAEDAISLGDSIEAAADPKELGRVWSELTAVTHALVHEEVDARDIAAIISRELRGLTRRACELAERELVKAGKGPAPVAYALLVLGSGGRGESLLAMDQDNAIVYADVGADKNADRWFEMLGKRVADILDDVGVAYCKGGVMASNAAWRQNLSGWRATVGSWIARSRPEDILNCDIFFDAVPVYGEAAMAEELLAEAREAARGARTFLNLLALNAADFRSPVGWFGRLRRVDGRIDLKLGGIMPIFSAARVVALRYGISAHTTPERLRSAGNLGIATPRTIDNLIEAHRILLDLILRQQLADIHQGLALSNKVATGDLTGLRRTDLRWALDQIPAVAELLGTPVLP